MTKDLYRNMIEAKDLWRKAYTYLNNEMYKFFKSYEKFDDDDKNFNIIFDDHDIVAVRSGIYIDQDFLDRFCEEFDFTLIYKKEELITNYQIGIDSFHISEYGFMANK